MRLRLRFSPLLSRVLILLSGLRLLAVRVAGRRSSRCITTPLPSILITSRGCPSAAVDAFALNEAGERADLPVLREPLWFAGCRSGVIIRGDGHVRHDRRRQTCNASRHRRFPGRLRRQGSGGSEGDAGAAVGTAAPTAAGQEGAMTKRRLPIGIQKFRKLRGRGLDFFRPSLEQRSWI